MTFKALVKRLLESGLEISAALKESAGLIEVYIDEDGEFKEAVMVKNDETLVPVAPESMWQQFSSDSPVTFTAENPFRRQDFHKEYPLLFSERTGGKAHRADEIGPITRS